jgi:hypothetical protein
MKTTQKIRFRRVGPGYYFSTKPFTIDGLETYVVIESNESGSTWMLRLESFPSMTTFHSTKAHARFALDNMIQEAGLVAAIQ